MSNVKYKSIEIYVANIRSILVFKKADAEWLPPQRPLRDASREEGSHEASLGLGVEGGGLIGGGTGTLTWGNQQGFGSSFAYTFNNEISQSVIEAYKTVADPVTGFMQGMANNFMEMMYGVGSAVSGMWRDEGSQPSNTSHLLDEKIRILEIEVEKLSNVAGPASKSMDNIRSIKARELEELRVLKSRNYFGNEGSAGTDDLSSLGWERVDKNSLFSGDKRLEQHLRNGVSNYYETIEHDGKISFYINNKKLNHGDGIVVGADGRLEVVSQWNLSKYVRDRGITDANVSVNGRDNTGFDAVMMAQATSLVVNDKAAEAGRLITQIHIFNDEQVPGSANVPLDFDKPDVQNSLRMLIEAGAFSTGGSIIGHSAGAHNVSAVIGGLREEDQIKATVYTFGGVHTAAYPDRVNGWNDYYNPNDYAIAYAKLKLPNVTNPQVIRDNTNSQASYSRNVNGQRGIRWGNIQQAQGGAGSYAYHSYSYNYQNALRKFYQLNGWK